MGNIEKPRVIDFFCGTGGFSEGFRQQGFKIVKGIDFRQPAIDTHNLNHNLKDSVKDVLDFRGENDSDIKDIEELIDTEIIIGSPSCVSFSSSNRSGKAEKSGGIRLIETYLRVIAVKKHKKDSILRARYMENVPNSKKYVKKFYTFQDLNLGGWANTIGLEGHDIALSVQNNSTILNAGDFGSPQNRERFIAGEWIETGEFLCPKLTHKEHISLGDVLDKLPPPNLKQQDLEGKYIYDPNYNWIKISMSDITDHFYDTGVYKMEWESAKYLKTKHPYMGKMSFPENRNRTSRTVLATRSPSVRESILYKSEYNRKGNGEYRLPTIREIASLMGFPTTYQFCGSEGIKRRQIGNAVCPHMSNALAKEIRKKLGFEEIQYPEIAVDIGRHKIDKIDNLNTFKKKTFTTSNKRNTSSVFRRHPIKSGNMTVELMNSGKKSPLKRNVSIFLGTGDAYKSIPIRKRDFLKTKEKLKKEYSGFSSFYTKLKNRFDEQGHIKSNRLQEIFEIDSLLINKSNPINIVNFVGDLIVKQVKKDTFISGLDFIPKSQVPLSQGLALLSLGEFVFNYID